MVQLHRAATKPAPWITKKNSHFVLLGRKDTTQEEICYLPAASREQTHVGIGFSFLDDGKLVDITFS